MAGKKGMKIKKQHEDSPRFPEYYHKLFPNLANFECEEKAKWYRKSCNVICIEYYERNYPQLSHEEHLKMLEDKKNQNKKNNKNHLEYYIENYPELTLEQQNELFHKHSKENNYQCEEFYLKRGANIEEAKQLKKEKLDIVIPKIVKKISGQNNGMSASNRTEQQRKESSPFSKEFYIKRGLQEEDRKKFNDDVSKNRSYNTKLSYYINQGLSEEEAYLKLKERQSTFTLEKCIEKYGEEIGHIKYTERQEKWLKKLYENFQNNGDGRSKQSFFAKIIITEICKYFDISIPKKEYYIYDKENKRAYAYDFNYNYHVIEFNGDYWHCNPKLYSDDFINKVKQKTAKEIWEYDNIKCKLAEKYNNKVLVIWESEYNENKKETIKKCIDFIKS